VRNIKRSLWTVRSASHQKEVDYIMIDIPCIFWDKFIDFIYAIYKKFPIPIFWIFLEHPDIGWQVAVAKSLLVVMGFTGLFQFHLVKYYV
jgi:hypothetical protein